MSNRRFAPKHRRDTNHKQIVGELTKLGFAVADISQSGGGVGDILVGWNGVNLMYELKPTEMRGSPASPSDQKLSAAEEIFHATWPGHIEKVTTTEEIVDDMAERHRRSREKW